MICDNIERDGEGELCFAGVKLSSLAKEYGTPLYLYDEARIRNRARTYLSSVKSAFGENAKVLYASKAASFKRLYEIAKEEGLGIDVVSVGEIYTAKHNSPSPSRSILSHIISLFCSKVIIYSYLIA